MSLRVKFWLTLGGEGGRNVPGRIVPKGNVGSEEMFMERKVSKQRRGGGVRKKSAKN